MKIEDYLNPPSNWDRLEIDYFDSLIFIKDGIQLIAGIKSADTFGNSLHVSLVPMRSLIENPEERVKTLILETPQILKEFFGERIFCKAPDHPDNPLMKNYFSPIGFNPNFN